MQSLKKIHAWAQMKVPLCDFSGGGGGGGLLFPHLDSRMWNMVIIELL